MKVKVKPLSLVRLLVTPWTAAHQAPLSMGFSRQEYWSGLPLPSPCDPAKGLKTVKACDEGGLVTKETPTAQQEAQFQARAVHSHSGQCLLLESRILLHFLNDIFFDVDHFRSFC